MGVTYRKKKYRITKSGFMLSTKFESNLHKDRCPQDIIANNSMIVCFLRCEHMILNLENLL